LTSIASVHSINVNIPTTFSADLILSRRRRRPKETWRIYNCRERKTAVVIQFVEEQKSLQQVVRSAKNTAPYLLLKED